MDTQFKKGVLELCVFYVLAKKECYGYEIVAQISQSIEVTEGTIYPLLRRLKVDGYVETYLEESMEGPPRKYYRLTQLGVKVFQELEQEWSVFSKKVNNFLGISDEKK